MTTYRDSGVDREAGEAWLQELDGELESQRRPEILSSVGGYGAEFKTPAHIREPIWVASTDGVGTKLMLAEEVAKNSETNGDQVYFGIGIDLVAMSVNDIFACRAEPVAFLDYLATGKIQKNRQQIFLKGVMEGCRQARCSLVGGETAEMPGFYAEGRMDVAGFAVGVRDARQKVESIQAGDWVLGLESSGFHSNGYSLIRKILEKNPSLKNEKLEGLSCLEFLLRPTRIYGNEIIPQLSHPQYKAGAHLTGGGVIENLPRVLPRGVAASLNRNAFPLSPWMQKFFEASGLEWREAFSTWNMGMGWAAVVSPGLGAELLKSEWLKLGEIQNLDSPNHEPLVVWNEG